LAKTALLPRETCLSETHLTLLQRQRITDGTATAKALDYSHKRWTALTLFLGDAHLPIDNE
jgi:hypothetical protein